MGVFFHQKTMIGELVDATFHVGMPALQDTIIVIIFFVTLIHKCIFMKEEVLVWFKHAGGR